MIYQQHRTRIKFCGFTRAQDAQLAVALGVDALGLVFYENSKRYITIEQAQTIVPHIPALVNSIGVFVNAEAAFVHQVLKKIKLSCLQFHGDENESYCRSFALPYIKVISMKNNIDVLAAIKQYPSASAIILDTYHGQQIGGSGNSFDWQLIPDNLPKPLILAGGLTVANVAEAITTMQPYGLDLSSGIESAPGIKDPQKMQQFIAAVHAADHAADQFGSHS